MSLKKPEFQISVDDDVAGNRLSNITRTPRHVMPSSKKRGFKSVSNTWRATFGLSLELGGQAESGRG